MYIIHITIYSKGLTDIYLYVFIPTYILKYINIQIGINLKPLTVVLKYNLVINKTMYMAK